MEEREGVTMDQPITANPYVKGIPTIESREEYSSFDNLSTSTLVLVQFPPSHDSTFHSSTEGHFGAQYWVFSPPSVTLWHQNLVQLILFGRLPWDRLFTSTTLLL